MPSTHKKELVFYRDGEPLKDANCYADNVHRDRNMVFPWCL